MKITVAQKRC